MAGKHVIPTEQMVAKLRAAAAARQDRDTFILARTDAIQPEGVDSALRRGEAYLQAGKPLDGSTGVDMAQFEQIVDLPK